MNNIVNYQKELERLCKQIELEGLRRRLLLHSCCAPCSSYCLVYLRKYFDITCLYYNPNITDRDEYTLRVNELHRLVDNLNTDPIYISYDDKGQAKIAKTDRSYLNEVGRIEVIDGLYEPDKFLSLVRKKDLSGEPEGGKRCEFCFNLRLKETARVANAMSFEYFTSSLTISPLKNATLLNTIGYNLANEEADNARWLYSDFKKKNGYLISIELCKRYEMYRQNYCGCVYSQPH